MILDQNNLLKVCYAYWSASSKPCFRTFAFTLQKMLESGEYVLSAKLLTSNPINKDRAEAAWICLLKPHTVTTAVVDRVMFGIKKGDAADERINSFARPKYSLSDFNLDEETATVLTRDVLQRRSNVVIVGPSGAGKSSLVYSLTYSTGCYTVGTADELKKVPLKIPFLIFDDFDFDSFSCDDCKRLFDREFEYQVVKTRYADAKLHCSTCRIVLCNTLPKHFNDYAVSSRMKCLTLFDNLFDASRERIKDRTTHLLYEEEPEEFDDVDEYDVGGMA